MPPATFSPFPKLPRTAPDVVPTIPVADCIRDVRPYVPVQSLEAIGRASDTGGHAEPLKLDWNESTIPPSPKVIEAVMRFMSGDHHVNWYPDLTCAPLREALSHYVGVPDDHILVTNGSDDALDLLCKTYLNPEDRVVLPYPTYTHFLVFAGARGARFDPVTYDNPFEGRIDRVISALTPWTKLVYLVNPNNPTGVQFTRDDVARLVRRAPLSLVVVDEAYFEFSGVSVADLTMEFPNLVVTRTFSKSFGIAGLRIGYLVARPEVIEDLRRVFNPKSVNVLGQVAATAALGDLTYHENYVREARASREVLADWLRRRGFDARSTTANWVLVKVPDPAAFVHALEARHVYIRDRSNFPQLAGWVRMSVGTAEQTGQLCDRLDDAFKELGIGRG